MRLFKYIIRFLSLQGFLASHERNRQIKIEKRMNGTMMKEAKSKKHISITLFFGSIANDITGSGT